MRKLQKPLFEAEDVFIECISNVSNSDLKSRYEECIPDVKSASDKFEILAEDTLLHTFVDDLCDNRNITIKEMKNVYSYKLANKNGPAYHIYNKLKRNTINKTCPFCGQRKADTLDHYLPKAHYPSLVVTPLNLVPACFACNKTKSSKTANSSEEETLHPYFDELGMDEFIFAEVNEQEQRMDFYINPPSSWSEQFVARVEKHFEDYNLAELYEIHAIDEIIGHLFTWRNLDKDSLKAHLVEQAMSWKDSYVHSWKASFFKGASESEWFCSGGYTEIMENASNIYD